MHNTIMTYVEYQVQIHVYSNLDWTAVIDDVHAPAALCIT